MSTDEHHALQHACLTYEQDLEVNGILFDVHGLKCSRDAIRVSVVAGQLLLTESPLARMPGPLIRRFCINARDLNEAIRFTAKMPQVRIGPIEVRPILELERPEPRPVSPWND
jgi:hypothetical protein